MKFFLQKIFFSVVVHGDDGFTVGGRSVTVGFGGGGGGGVTVGGGVVFKIRRFLLYLFQQFCGQELTSP